MRRFGTLAIALGITILLAGCGGRTVDEELLPTRVPTFGPADFAVTLAATPAPPPTATPLPATPTSLPVVELATAEPEATEVLTPTVEVTATDEPDETVTPAATEALTPTVEATATDEPDETVTPAATETPAATVEATATGTPDETVTPAATETLTATVEAAATDEPDETVTPAPTRTLTPTVEAGGLIPSPTPTRVPSTPTPAATPTEPAPEAAAEQDSTLDGLPDNLLAAMADADPARGEQLTLTNGCIGCHALNPNQVMAGPTWHNVGATAATRVEGESAALYLYNSIFHPNDYVVEGYMPNIMLQIYEQTLSDQDVADIISYLLSLQGE
ncbi:MAG: c-type cytochrome [Chloroflexota bacterium]|nr:c-type cytochrome [Chloroflexota bacterium]